MGNSTGQGEVTALFGWEDNRRPGVALAIRHRRFTLGESSDQLFVRRGEHLSLTRDEVIEDCPQLPGRLEDKQELISQEMR